MRLRAGEPLYPPVPDPAAVDIFKYAPWFAWMWVPLTYLPKTLVGVGWSAVLVTASAAAIWPVIGRRPSAASLAAGALLGSILIWSAASGNVQPLLVAVLVWTVERRSGPLWIGAAASLKIFPLLYAVVYVGRREWLRAVAAAVAAFVLWAPVLFYDLANYQGGFGDSPSPFLAVHPVLYGAGLLIAVGVALASAPTRHAWAAAATAVFVSLPRVSLIDLTHLCVAAAPWAGREWDRRAR